ncbi:hypothetical protein [Arhodomonas sp. AD133]|uniref:hypothetical protein n=1 Tax=Arhodomonas sp. AD133 TaxID=3415009 RepID=UPI003EBA258A
MARYLWIVAAGLLMVSGSAVGEVYKCEVDGEVEFSDKPCADDPTKIERRPEYMTPYERRQAEREKRRKERKAREERLEQQRIERQREIRKERERRSEERYARRKARMKELKRKAKDAPPEEKELFERIHFGLQQQSVVVGMTEADVNLIKGRPDSVNRTTTAYGTSKQWIYGSFEEGDREYIYLENGRVTSIQD